MNFTWLFVGVLYFAATWRRVPIRLATFFYLLTLIFLWQPLTQPVVNFSTDVVRLLPPWSNPRVPFDKYDVQNFEIADVTMQIVPWMEQTRMAWKRGEIPLWNASAAAGYPLLANGQSAGLSPLRILTLPLPLGYAVTAEAAMKILIALTFTFLYLRRRYGELPSAIGAVMFGFSSFLIVWLHFPLATTAAYLPAVLLMIDLIAEKQTLGRIAGGAIVWVCILFSGHPETAAHIFFFALLAIIPKLVAGRRPQCGAAALGGADAPNAGEGAGATLRTLLTLGAAMTLAALLAAPWLATFAETVVRSRRFHDMQATPHTGVPFSDFASAVLLVQPHFYGRVPHEIPWGPSFAEAITGWAGILGLAAWLALLLKRREWFYVIAAALIFAIVVDWPPVSVPFRAIFSIALNARLRLFLCFLAAAMAAAAIDYAIREKAWPLLAGCLGAAATLLILMRAVDFPSAFARDGALLALMPSLAVLAIATLFAFSRRLGAIAILFVVIIELWTPLRPYNPIHPLRTVYPTTPLIAKLKQLAGDQTVRIAGIGPAFFPNLPAMWGFEDVRQHDPMAPKQYLDYVQLDLRDYYAKWTDAASPKLDFLGAKYLVTPPGQTLNEPLLYDGPDGRIYENRGARPRFWADGASVLIDRRSATDFRLTIDTPHEMLISSSQPWWPGWKVDGARATKIENAFLGFTVPPGRSEVRVRYAPATFRWGSAVSLATLLALLASIIRARK